MLNCKNATALVSQGLEQPLPLRQRLALRLHLTICHWCRDYARQIRFLHRIAPAMETHIENQAVQLPEQARAAAQAKIESELENKGQ